MKGLITEGNGTIYLSGELPMPEIDDYQALTKTIACGICNGTDLKLLDGHLRGFSTYPAVLGHESVGEIIKVGAKVRNYKVGDRVLRTTLKDMRGVYSLWGGFAEYGYVDDYQARLDDNVPANVGLSTQQVIPNNIDPVGGTMLITLKEVCSALHRLGLKKGMDVVIVGCGPVGLSMASLSKLMGAGRVIMSGHHRPRLVIGERLGADIVVNSKEEDMIQVVKENIPEGVDLFIDCVGKADIVNQGMKVVKEIGKVGLYGTGGIRTGDFIDWDNFPYNFEIHSVQWPIPLYEREVHGEVLRYIVARKLNLEEFVSHVLPIEEYEKGFELVRSRRGLKVVLKF